MRDPGDGDQPGHAGAHGGTDSQHLHEQADEPGLTGVAQTSPSECEEQDGDGEPVVEAALDGEDLADVGGNRWVGEDRRSQCTIGRCQVVASTRASGAVRAGSSGRASTVPSTIEPTSPMVSNRSGCPRTERSPRRSVLDASLNRTVASASDATRWNVDDVMPMSNQPNADGPSMRPTTTR